MSVVRRSFPRLPNDISKLDEATQVLGVSPTRFVPNAVYMYMYLIRMRLGSGAIFPMQHEWLFSGYRTLQRKKALIYAFISLLCSFRRSESDKSVDRNQV